MATKYTEEQIEDFCRKMIVYIRYDKREDVYVNKWSIQNWNGFGIWPRPECETPQEAEEILRKHLTTHFKK